MKKLILSVINHFGYDVVKGRSPYVLEQQNYNILLKSYAIDIILDIGANVGQYAESIITNGYEGEVISFEPMPKEHKILQQKSSIYKNWNVYLPVALGEKEEEIKFNISKNSVSSSMLKLTDYVMSTSPDTQYISEITVPMISLDSIFDELTQSFRRPFLKLDVQGAEQQVLLGAKNSIGKISGLHVEFSLRSLYDGQANMSELYMNIISLGFNPVYFMPHGTFDTAGRMLQVDVLFFRN